MPLSRAIRPFDWLDITFFIKLNKLREPGRARAI
jgi:hypothetical protein